MEINILSPDQEIKQDGLNVVIDVLRAFSVVCYAFGKGVKSIIPVKNIDAAYALKKENPEFVLLGERHGKKPPGFDFGNSPSELLDAELSNKTMVHTTSCGTRSLVDAFGHGRVITGSFVNSKAIVDFIKANRFGVVNLVCTNRGFEHNEDVMCAEYIKSCLEGNPASFEDIKNDLRSHESSAGFFDENVCHLPEKDFELCLDLDRFDFVLEAVKDENSEHIRLIKL